MFFEFEKITRFDSMHADSYKTHSMDSFNACTSTLHKEFAFK